MFDVPFQKSKTLTFRLSNNCVSFRITNSMKYLLFSFRCALKKEEVYLKPSQLIMEELFCENI